MTQRRLWSAIKTRYARPLTLPRPAMPPFAHNDALCVVNAIEGMELRSRSLDEIADRLLDFVHADDVEALRKVMPRAVPPLVA